ncbi:MAG: hypothetical protein CL433_11935 [Acidimicrobiaceae bacterium]|nr:hypothetical protein [Acidimicrobiaceae bacterium]
MLCEYDALPGISHACGHNTIRAAGLGAGLAVAKVARALGGRVVSLGTPAEEGGGGKEFMIRRGAFDDIRLAVIVHPADRDLRTMHTIAIQQLDVQNAGRAAHAAAGPHMGLKALDAAVLGYNAVAALRQHIRPEERIHGIFADGGDKPNIVPSKGATEWYVRSGNMDSLQALKARVLDCLHSGALSAGCEVHHKWIDPPFCNMIDNRPLLDLYVQNAMEVGRHPLPEMEGCDSRWTDRHGKCQLLGPRNSPHDQGVTRGHTDPHTRGRSARRTRGRGSGRHRRCADHGAHTRRLSGK